MLGMLYIYHRQLDMKPLLCWLKITFHSYCLPYTKQEYESCVVFLFIQFYKLNFIKLKMLLNPITPGGVDSIPPKKKLEKFI